MLSPLADAFSFVTLDVCCQRPGPEVRKVLTSDVRQWIDNDSMIVTLPGAGHFIQHERVPQIVRAVRSRLSSTANP